MDGALLVGDARRNKEGLGPGGGGWSGAGGEVGGWGGGWKRYGDGARM